MSEVHLIQPGFTCSACGPFTKNKERIQKFKKTNYIYSDIFIKTNQIKIGFQLYMCCGDLNDLTRRTASDKILCNKAFNIAKNPKHNGSIALIVCIFFEKETASGGTV